MPSYGSGNSLQEMSILFPVNPFLHFHAVVPIDSKIERKSTAVSKKNVLIFYLFASYFWDMSYMCLLFSSLLFSSFVEGRIWKDLSNEKILPCAEELATLIHAVYI